MFASMSDTHQLDIKWMSQHRAAALSLLTAREYFILNNLNDTLSYILGGVPKPELYPQNADNCIVSKN